MNFVYHINYLIEDKRNAVLYGLKLCKHVELIWYYHMEFVFFFDGKFGQNTVFL